MGKILEEIVQLSRVSESLRGTSVSEARLAAVEAVLKRITVLMGTLGKEGEGCCHEPHTLFVQGKLVRIGADNIPMPVEDYEGSFQDDALRSFIRHGAGQTYEIVQDNRDKLVIKWKTQDV